MQHYVISIASFYEIINDILSMIKNGTLYMTNEQAKYLSRQLVSKIIDAKKLCTITTTKYDHYTLCPNDCKSMSTLMLINNKNNYAISYTINVTDKSLVDYKYMHNILTENYLQKMFNHTVDLIIDNIYKSFNDYNKRTFTVCKCNTSKFDIKYDICLESYDWYKQYTKTINKQYKNNCDIK